MCPADMGDMLKPSQSFGTARVSHFNCLLREKDEAAEVGKRKKYTNCFSMDLCIDFLKIIVDTLIWDCFFNFGILCTLPFC